jgi:hypothetical protein
MKDEGDKVKTNNIHWGRAVVASLLATVSGFIAGFVLYSSVNGIYESYGDLPYAKSVESVPSYLLQMVAGGMVLNVLLALVYAVIHEALPGQKKWQKGLSFWVMLLVVNMLPIAFNAWMQVAQPVTLILVEAMNRTIGLLVAALVMAAVYGRPGVASQAREAGAD